MKAKQVIVMLLTMISFMCFGLSFNKIEAAAGEAISIGTGTNDASAGTNTWNIDNVVTMVQRKGSASDAVVGTYNTASTARFYIGHILEFTAIEGYSITKVEFKNANSTSYLGSNHKLGTLLSDNSVTDNKSLFNYTEGTTKNSLVTIEPISDATGSHFYFQIQGKQTRPQSFTITYKSVNANQPIEQKFQTSIVMSNISFNFNTTSSSSKEVSVKVNDSLKFINGYGNETTENTYDNGRAKLEKTNLYYYDLTGFSGYIIYSGSFYHNGTAGTSYSTFEFVLLDATKQPIESTRVKDIVTKWVTAPTNSNGLSAQEFIYDATITNDVKYLGIDFTKTSGNIALDLTISGSKVTPTYDFRDLQMNFKYEYDLSNESTVTDQGFVVTSNSSFTFTQGMEVNSFTETDNTKKYSKELAENASVGSFTLGIKINTIVNGAYNYTDCTKKLYAAAYIVVGGKMYFSNVCNNGNGYSVNDILSSYITDINGSNTYGLKEFKDVIEQFNGKFSN